MSTGKCWTLKMSKEDQTTPGPNYEIQHMKGRVKMKRLMTAPNASTVAAAVAACLFLLVILVSHLGLGLGLRDSNWIAGSQIRQKFGV